MSTSPNIALRIVFSNEVLLEQECTSINNMMKRSNKIVTSGLCLLEYTDAGKFLKLMKLLKLMELLKLLKLKTL